MTKSPKALREQDLVLIYIDEKPAFYARVEKITPDIKKNWWRVTFLVLTLPATVATWIIDNDQIRGADFTMGGTPVRIERLIVPEIPEANSMPESSQEQQQGKQDAQKARILSFPQKQKPKSSKS